MKRPPSDGQQSPSPLVSTQLFDSKQPGKFRGAIAVIRADKSARHSHDAKAHVKVEICSESSYKRCQVWRMSPHEATDVWCGWRMPYRIRSSSSNDGSARAADCDDGSCEPYPRTSPTLIASANNSSPGSSSVALTRSPGTMNALYMFVNAACLPHRIVLSGSLQFQRWASSASTERRRCERRHKLPSRSYRPVQMWIRATARCG